MLLDQSSSAPMEVPLTRLALADVLSGKQTPTAAAQTADWKIQSESKYARLPRGPMLGSPRTLQTASRRRRMFGRRSRGHPYPNTGRVPVVFAPPHGAE